jgi:enterochelin esterase-like enzyme
MVKLTRFLRGNEEPIMKKLFFFLFLTILIGCRLQPETTAGEVWPAPACGEPGRVLPDSVTETERGYPYPFNIYLPPCYESETGRRYPVLYLLPGRGGGPGDWFAAGADKTADDLILSGEIPPFIIVTTESIDIDRYGDAIFNDLLPYVDQHYRSRTERTYRAVAGASLGGIGAYRLALRHPDAFASVGLFGSGIVSGEEEAVREWLAAVPPENPVRVFLNCGQQDNLMLAQAEEFVSLLGEAGIESTLLVSQGEHTYAYWVSNLPAYFRWLVKDW